MSALYRIRSEAGGTSVLSSFSVRKYQHCRWQRDRYYREQWGEGKGKEERRGKGREGRGTRKMMDRCTHLVAINIAGDRGISLICAMNMAAIASYKAPPSMFTVAPKGSTNLLIRSSIWLFSSRHRMVVGSVAELNKHNDTCDWRKLCP